MGGAAMYLRRTCKGQRLGLILLLGKHPVPVKLLVWKEKKNASDTDK